MTPSGPPRLRAPFGQFRQRPLRRRVIRRGLSRRLRIAGFASLLIHLMIGVLLLVTIRLERQSDLLPPPAAVTMLFDSGRRNGPTEPQPQPNASPSPTPPAPENPPAVEAPAPPAELLPPPVPPPLVQTPPPTPPVTPPLPAPPLPAPPPPLPPPPQTAPLQTAPPPPAQTPETEPAPPPPPAPAPPPPPVKRAAPAKPPDFPAPMNYSFGTSLPRLHAPSPAHPPGTTSFALGPAKPGPADDTPYADVDGDNAGPDWRNALSRWVSEHAYYPPQARNEGEQGDARVHVVALPNGRVTSVELIGRSGSMWLDLALQALFRDAHIPPLPSGAEQQIEFNFTMHYILIRR